MGSGGITTDNQLFIKNNLIIKINSVLSKFYLHVTYGKTTMDLLYNKQLKRDNKCVKRTASRDSTCTCVNTD